jgi:serine protease
LALFTDWDIGDAAKNAAIYDANLKMGYTYAVNEAKPYVGVKLLSEALTPLFYPLSYQVANDPLQDGSFSISEKFETLSNGIKATTIGADTGLDVMYVIGNGPFDISANSSVKVAFAIVAGDDLFDINQSAIATQAKYEQLNINKTEFEVGQNFPNPLNQQTQVSVYIPNEGNITIEVYDLTGKKVSTPINNNYRKGMHTLTLDIRNLKSGIYFYKTSFNSQNKVMKMIVSK